MGGRGAAILAGKQIGKAAPKPRTEPQPKPQAERVATTTSGQDVVATTHFLEQSAERNLSRSDIVDAIENPLHVSEPRIDKRGRVSVQYIGRNATVAVNPENGNATTVWKTGEERLKKYAPKEGDES